VRAGRDRVHHISIGRFAGLTGISANTLRRYDQVGLLSPAFTDPSTGYRLHAVEQLDVGILLRLLPNLDVPLEEVKALMVPGPVRQFYLVDERDTGDPQRYVTEITWPVQRRTTSLD